MRAVDAIGLSIAGYIDFDGRTPRCVYWPAIAATHIAAIAAGVFDASVMNVFIGPATCITALAIFPMQISSSIRRLHDIGRSGWWMLLVLVPILNLVFFAMMLTSGNYGRNAYGYDPLRPHIRPAAKRAVSKPSAGTNRRASDRDGSGAPRG